MTRLEGEEGRVARVRGRERGGGRRDERKSEIPLGDSGRGFHVIHRRPRRRFETFAQRTYCPELKEETKR